MINYDNTLLRPLAEEILKDDKVVDSYYYINHPEIDNPQLYVKVSTGKPQAAIKRTIKRMNKISGISVTIASTGNLRLSSDISLL